MHGVGYGVQGVEYMVVCVCVYYFYVAVTPKSGLGKKWSGDLHVIE